MQKNAEEIIVNLRSIIPSFVCPPGCHDCCGPHPWSRWEWEQVRIKRSAVGLTCPYVTPAGCEVYEHRPIVCRLFGTVSGLPCPHGRRPFVLLSPLQEKEIMRTYLQLIQKEGSHAEHGGNHRIT